MLNVEGIFQNCTNWNNETPSSAGQEAVLNGPEWEMQNTEQFIQETELRIQNINAYKEEKECYICLAWRPLGAQNVTMDSFFYRLISMYCKSVDFQDLRQKILQEQPSPSLKKKKKKKVYLTWRRSI